MDGGYSTPRHDTRVISSLSSLRQSSHPLELLGQVWLITHHQDYLCQGP